MRTARRQGQPLRRPKTGLTIGEYWQRWWREEITVAKARATQYSYRDTYAANIAPRIGHLKLRQLIDDPQLLIDRRWSTPSACCHRCSLRRLKKA
jgi:hypothetical protein